MNMHKRTLAAVLGGTVTTMLAVSPIAKAEQNPFAMQPLAQGYMVAEAEPSGDVDKMKDGNCSAEMMGKDETANPDSKDKESSGTESSSGEDGSGTH